jgi:hypothetical protein
MSNDVLTQKQRDPNEKGIILFNEGRYSEAIEAWEIQCRNTDDMGETRFLEGLMLVAGAFHHYLRRECTGAAALVEQSLPLVRSGINTHPNLRISQLAGALEDVLDEFESCSLRVSLDALPKIGCLNPGASGRSRS